MTPRWPERARAEALEDVTARAEWVDTEAPSLRIESVPVASHGLCATLPRTAVIGASPLPASPPWGLRQRARQPPVFADALPRVTIPRGSARTHAKPRASGAWERPSRERSVPTWPTPNAGRRRAEKARLGRRLGPLVPSPPPAARNDPRRAPARGGRVQGAGALRSRARGRWHAQPAPHGSPRVLRVGAPVRSHRKFGSR